MGLFSSKKKTYVSSVTYPLGEDGSQRMDILKHTVINATMQGASVGEAIPRALLTGQGVGLLSAFNYARTKYVHGVPVSSARYADRPDNELLRDVLEEKHPDAQIEFLLTIIGSANYEWFAERYLAEEYGYDRVVGAFEQPPVGVDPNANLAYDLEKTGVIRILLMNDNGTTKVIDYRPTDYNQMTEYAHCAYRTVQQFESGGTDTRAALPGETNSITTAVHITERAGETQEVTERTTITIGAEGTVATVETYKQIKVTSRPQYFIYRLGSGRYPELDAWYNSTPLESPYFPSVPLRLNNVNMTTEAKQDTKLYKTGKQLVKRVGLDLQKVSDNLHDNASIKDIDYAFITFGVALNTESQEGKRYLFRYFQYLRSITSAATTKASYDQWHTQFTQGSVKTPPAMNKVEVYSGKDRANNHDIKIQWDYIDTKLVSGVIAPNAKPGDVDISMSGIRREIKFMIVDAVVDSSKLYARRQIDANTYEELEISGLVYENFVYKGKSVIVSAYEAFHDPEEEGFIIPLNQQILRSTPMVELTNLSYQVCHLVINCYKVVKQKWYQRGIFKFILMIVAAVVMYFFPPAGVAAMSAALSGAVVAGVIISAVIAKIISVIVAMVVANLLMRILSPLAVDLFGEKWGALIAAVAVMVIGGGLSNMVGGGTFAAGVTNTVAVTSSNLINASTAVMKFYGAYTQGQMAGLAADAKKAQDQYTAQMEKLEDLTEELMDGRSNVLDIEGMMDATQRIHFERLDQFLSRTLITGSDVAAMTNGMISNFADLGLRLPTT